MINGGVYGGCSAQHGGGRGTRLLLVHHRLGGGHRQGRSLQYPLLKKAMVSRILIKQWVNM